MQTSFIITFIGDDRPGLLEALSRVIAEQGGNWQESRLSQLAGKFAGLISVSLPQNRGPQLEAALKGLSTEGLSVRVRASGEHDAVQHAQSITLSILGPDRPGIVREIAAALGAREINVVEMDSTVISAAMSAEALFEANVRAQVPEGTDMDELSERLDEIANLMTVDINLEPG